MTPLLFRGGAGAGGMGSILANQSPSGTFLPLLSGTKTPLLFFIANPPLYGISENCILFKCPLELSEQRIRL